MVSQIRTVCFDLDDTLCDSENAEEGRLRRALQPLAQKLPTYLLEDLVDRALTVDPTHGRLVTLISEVGITDPAVMDEAYDIYDATVDEVQLFPEAEDVLQHLSRRFPLVLIGNGDTKEQRNKIRHLGIEKYFKHILIGQEEGAYKPDLEMYKRAFAKAGVQPDEMLFVGDRIDEDVRGPKEAGSPAVWVARGLVRSVPGAVQPDYTISSLRDLLRILEV